MSMHAASASGGGTNFRNGASRTQARPCRTLPPRVLSANGSPSPSATFACSASCLYHDCREYQGSSASVMSSGGGRGGVLATGAVAAVRRLRRFVLICTDLYTCWTNSPSKRTDFDGTYFRLETKIAASEFINVKGAETAPGSSVWTWNDRLDNSMFKIVT